MAEPLRFHPLVADDLQSATGWYDDISVELGNRFRDAVDSRLDSVELHPESFGLVDESLRAAQVGGFPYLIIFEFSVTAIEVLGIFHTASNPSKWRARKR
jgi:hypothetical protein